MNSGVKKPAVLSGLGLPRLPKRPGDVVVVDLGEGPVAMPDQFVLDTATLSSLERGPEQLLKENLGELRRRIVSDPSAEDAHETMESYWTRIEMTTLSDVLLIESRIWQKHMSNKNPYVQKIALSAYDRIVQNKNFLMCEKDFSRGSADLYARIEQGDLDVSRRALQIYQGLMKMFFRGQSELLDIEVSVFRIIAEKRICRVLSENQTEDIDADEISHLNHLLKVYSQIIFYDGIALREIVDGIGWIETYMSEGHVLEQRATEVRASLDKARDLIGNKKDPSDQGDSHLGESNGLPSVSGEIDTEGNGVSMDKTPSSDIPKIIV